MTSRFLMLPEFGLLSSPVVCHRHVAHGVNGRVERFPHPPRRAQNPDSVIFPSPERRPLPTDLLTVLAQRRESQRVRVSKAGVPLPTPTVRSTAASLLRCSGCINREHLPPTVTCGGHIDRTQFRSKCTPANNRVRSCHRPPEPTALLTHSPTPDRESQSFRPRF